LRLYGNLVALAHGAAKAIRKSMAARDDRCGSAETHVWITRVHVRRRVVGALCAMRLAYAKARNRTGKVHGAPDRRGERSQAWRNRAKAASDVQAVSW